MTSRMHRASASGAVLTVLGILAVFSYSSICPAQAPATQPAADPAEQASPARLGVQVYRLELPPSEIEKLKKSLAESTDDVPSLDNDLRRQGLLADVGFVAVDLRNGAKLEAPKVFPARRQVRGQTLMVAAKGKLEVSLPSVQFDSNDPPTGQVNVGVSLSDLTEASRSGKALPAETVSPFKVEYKGLIAPGKPAKVFTEPGPDKCVYLVWIRVKAPAAQPAGREVFIPDADTKGKGVVLDLASGEMLPAGEKDQFGHFAKLGKGDLAFDRALICLRGARTMRLEKDEVSPMKLLQSMGDMSAYELPQAPCRLLVLVGKDKVYEIEIRKLVDGGIAIRYGQARPREARKAIEAKQGVARPANESSFWQQNGPATRPAALVPVPARKPPSHRMIAVRVASDGPTWAEDDTTGQRQTSDIAVVLVSQTRLIHYFSVFMQRGRSRGLLYADGSSVGGWRLTPHSDAEAGLCAQR